MTSIHVAQIAKAIGDDSLTDKVEALRKEGTEEKELYPLMKDIFIKLGYKNEEILRQASFSVQIGKSRKTAEPDITLRVGKEPVVVIELKRPSLAISDGDYQQGLSYSVLLGIPYALITNGVRWDLIESLTGIIVWRQVAETGEELILILKGLRDNKEKAIAELKKRLDELPNRLIHENEAFKVLRTFMGVQEISNVFDQFNNLLRTEAGIGDPKSRLYEMMKLLTVKQLDEKRFYEDGKLPTFIGIANMDQYEVSNNVHHFFENAVVSSIKGVFDPTDKVNIGEPLVVYSIMKELEEYSLYRTRRDVIGLAYERFLSKVMVGRGIGDFFTPREIVHFMVNMVSPSPTSTIIDPAVGTGGFLLEAYNYIYDFHGSGVASHTRENLYGIDVDEMITKLCRVNMFLHVGNNWKNIVRKDSLLLTDLPLFALKALDNPSDYGFSIALTNPPFGRGKDKNIKDPEKLRLFNNPVAKDANGDVREAGADMQTLFLELCLRLLKPGGRCGIVLDDGVLGNMSMPIGRGSNEPVYLRLREWFMKEAVIWAIISLPQKAFEPYGSGAKTSLLFFQRRYDGMTRPDEVFHEPDEVLHGRANHIGYKLQRQKYDPISLNDFPHVESRFKDWLEQKDYSRIFFSEIP
jgi:type I restriction enzyme M protein